MTKSRESSRQRTARLRAGARLVSERTRFLRQELKNQKAREADLRRRQKMLRLNVRPGAAVQFLRNLGFSDPEPQNFIHLGSGRDRGHGMDRETGINRRTFRW